MGAAHHGGPPPKGASDSSQPDVEVWRPTASSFRSLTLFAAALCAAAAAVLATSHSVELTLVTLALGLAAGFALTLTVTRNRVRVALESAEHPALGNWPGTTQERRDLVRRGRVRAARAVAMALVLGALAGFYPVVGVAAVGAGAAGAVSGFITARMVHRFEVDGDVTVFSPSGAGGIRRRLRFGVVAGRP